MRLERHSRNITKAFVYPWVGFATRGKNRYLIYHGWQSRTADGDCELVVEAKGKAEPLET
jgi:hypothetical protein